MFGFINHLIFKKNVYFIAFHIILETAYAFLSYIAIHVLINFQMPMSKMTKNGTFKRENVSATDN